MVRVAPHAAPLLAALDTIIFDVDGVLLDVSRSIRQVNCLVIPAYLNRLPDWTAPEDLLYSWEIELFKHAGGFNDDWDLSCALALLYLFKAARHGSRDAALLHSLSPTLTEYTDNIAQRGGWLRNAERYLIGIATPDEKARMYDAYDPALIHQLFQELWAGDLCPRLYGYEPQFYPGPGKCREDKPLLDRALLPNLPLAILTGRTRAEAEFALELVGLSDRIPLPQNGMTRTEGNQKPDPDGLRRLVAQLGCKTALYIGDAVDDLRTVLHFRDLPESADVTVLSAQVLTGTAGSEAEPLFVEADILAPDVNAVLRLCLPRASSATE
ncbi:MAG: TIGR01548 family HAD-type hydrolase [Armatimonadaceae bacterium]